MLTSVVMGRRTKRAPLQGIKGIMRVNAGGIRECAVGRSHGREPAGADSLRGRGIDAIVADRFDRLDLVEAFEEQAEHHLLGRGEAIAPDLQLLHDAAHGLRISVDMLCLLLHYLPYLPICGAIV
ncbi:MAG: hypothetical protein AB7R89_24010 [Dehalococcoidia bacterium]